MQDSKATLQCFLYSRYNESEQCHGCGKLGVMIMSRQPDFVGIVALHCSRNYPTSESRIEKVVKTNKLAILDGFAKMEESQ